jgi:hypothetical protein
VSVTFVELPDPDLLGALLLGKASEGRFAD